MQLGHSVPSPSLEEALALEPEVRIAILEDQVKNLTQAMRLLSSHTHAEGKILVDFDTLVHYISDDPIGDMLNGENPS